MKPYPAPSGDLESRSQRSGVSGLLEPGEVWLNVGYWFWGVVRLFIWIGNLKRGKLPLEGFPFGCLSTSSNTVAKRAERAQ